MRAPGLGSLGSLGSRVTLTRALVALGVLLVGINVASAVWDVKMERERTERRAVRDFTNLASLLAEQTTAAIQAADLLLLDALSRLEKSGAREAAALPPRLQGEMLRLPQVAGLFVVDREGRVVAATQPPPTADDVRIDRPYFTAHRDARSGRPFVSEPFASRTTGRSIFVLSRRLNGPDGEFDGVLAVAIDIEYFERLYRAIDVGHAGFITLRSRDGALLARSPAPDQAGGPLLFSAADVAGFPLQVRSGGTQREVLAPWRDAAGLTALRTLLTSAAMVALIGLAAWGLARHERARRRSEKRFRAMIEHGSDAFMVTNPADGAILYTSPSFERVTGYTMEDLRGRKRHTLLHEDHVQDARQLLAELLRTPGKVLSNEVLVRHKDGSWRWIENTMSNLVHEPSVGAVVMNFRDITERKLAEGERARLEQRLRQAEKMEAVGRLAGGIAHDFNNILGGILGYGEMLAEQAPEGSALKRYANNVLTAASRASALVDQILSYSRSQRARRVPVDLCRIVAETLDLERGSVPPGIELVEALPAAPLFVVGDATQLHQVLMNVCTNAIQAMGSRGTLRVALDRTDFATDRAFAHAMLHAGAYVCLTVQDSGPGMDEATLARIFEPFFTTKEAGKGTGLGLSLVYGIVTDSGGAIDVKSAAGRGSTFTIYLPRVDAANLVADENEGPVPRGNGERVLVVDDEEALAAVTSEALRRLGYEPVAVSEGAAALAELEPLPQRYQAVITDEVMPGLTGTQLAGRLRRRGVRLPILLVSGYLGPMMAERAASAGVTEILKKPLQSRELAHALARVLQRA